MRSSSIRRSAGLLRLLRHTDQPVRRLLRIAALRRLAGEHQAVRPVQHGVVDVHHLRAGRGGVVDHAVQQLGHHQKRLPAAAAHGGDVLLSGGQLRQRQAAAQIAPGDGHHVAQLQPLGQGVHALPVFHLGKQLRLSQAAARHGGADGPQVVSAADEGLHHGADAQRGSLRQIIQIRLTQGAPVQLCSHQRQALAAGEHAALRHAAPAALHHGEGHGSIVQQHGHLRCQRLQHVLCHGDLAAQRDRLSLRQRHRRIQRADTHLRPPQIDHQLGGAPAVPLRAAQRVDPAPPRGQRRVGQIEPEAGNAPPQQGGKHLRLAAGRPQCGVISHASASL